MKYRNTSAPILVVAVMIGAGLTGNAFALEKETSLVTKTPIGELAVAGRLSIDLHAEFMVSRTYEKDTVLNWYNCGYSGGGQGTKVGGNFGDFGFQVPYREREAKYPHAVTVDKVRAVRFDGGDFMKGNFVVEKKIAGAQNMALEIWLRAEAPASGDVIMSWQSPDGRATSASVGFPPEFKGSTQWRHIVVNCTPETEDWYLDGAQVATAKRSLIIQEGHIPVLGGASSAQPSFKGDLAAVRLHDEAMTGGEIAHNSKGGVMLGTTLQNWWRTEPDKWTTLESARFRYGEAKETTTAREQNPKELKEFNDRVPNMFNMAELIYHTYSERLALRSSVVSVLPEERGDGIKYKTPIQESGGSWMGWDSHFGWACQGAGHINPHELAHGWSAMTGNMAGNFWEVFANWPQTYNGIYQTTPTGTRESSVFFPAMGWNYYHCRSFFEHLAQTPEFGPMFIAKLWYDGPIEGGDKNRAASPFATFKRLNAIPERPLAEEYTRMAMRNVTWDYTTFKECKPGEKGNTPYGNDGVVNGENLYAGEWQRLRENRTFMRDAQTLLERIPYEPEWWRVPKAMAPQQLGYNVCPLSFKAGTVTATLAGYVNPERGGDWRAAFVGVDAQGKPVYGTVFGPGTAQSFDATADLKELYLVVCAVPTNIMEIDMVGDFRSFEQEPFPYQVKLAGCEPLDVLKPEKPAVEGAPHGNGGGFVAKTAQVDASAYVAPGAQVLGASKVLGTARIEDTALVQDSTVMDAAVLSDHAAAIQNSTVSGHAKIRDYGEVKNHSTLTNDARVLEHGSVQSGNTCGDRVTAKGFAHPYGGNQRGTAMLDGPYAKGNEIVRGKWFTWSWGQGKNPGEEDVEFGGLYADYDFANPHAWMARDAFGATWGYLVGDPKFEATAGRPTIRVTLAKTQATPTDPKQAAPGTATASPTSLLLNGLNQFVALPKDVADFRSCTYEVEFRWDGGSDARIFEFAGADGDAVWLTPSESGKLVFGIRKGSKVDRVAGPEIRKGEWTTVHAMVHETEGMSLFVDGKKVGNNGKVTVLPEDVRATTCFLGRGQRGGYMNGALGRFTVYSVALVDEQAPGPNPAQFELCPIMVSPESVLLAATPGTDPLGNVEYWFEEQGGDWNSGWVKTAKLKAARLGAGKQYRVKMRDMLGNETGFSAFAPAAWVEPGTRVYDLTSDQPTVIEAEHFVRSTPSPDGFKWEAVTDPAGFVGAGAMRVVPDKRVNVEPPQITAARLDYLINVTKPGRWFVWLRAFGANPESDSVNMGFDMEIETPGRNVGFRSGRYLWDGRREFNIEKPGLHTFSIWMREDGAMVDRILFTQDPPYEPDREQRAPDKALIGNGPPESPASPVQ